MEGRGQGGQGKKEDTVRSSNIHGTGVTEDERESRGDNQIMIESYLKMTTDIHRFKKPN